MNDQDRAPRANGVDSLSLTLILAAVVFLIAYSWEILDTGLSRPWQVTLQLVDYDTWAVFVEGASGVVVYGEIQPEAGLVEGARVEPGQVLGRILQVLKTPKGRPATMLHLELHAPGTRSAPGWDHGQPRPATLLDPTPWLLALVNRAPGPDP